MNVTFRQLKLFLALVELRSLTAVAHSMHVTQPTVSMQMRDLQDAVGLPLYEVIGKQLYITAAGEELAIAARAMTEEWSVFGQKIAAMQGLTQGRLRLAVVSTAKYFVPRMLGAFCREFPEIDIALEVQNRDGVLQRLRENRDDLTIMSMPPKDLDIEQEIFLPNPLRVIAAVSHPLAARKRLKLSDLAHERFILREKGSGTRLACDRYFSDQGFQARVRLELGSNEAIKQAVAAEMGIAVLSQHALGEHLVDESLLELPVAGFPIHSNWYIVYPKGKRLTPVAQKFLSYLQASTRESEGSAFVGRHDVLL
ncbi:LysR family transcriptional regulator [Undibacterium sp. CY7W]|uniref:LysR family transcriptional regulator n=1 Tax=Undibacterium rugosum TaxID=2762291 RepID=A0A923KVT6_9BURK|nr:LysR family transcriptional regulator [Undibacterium rugosum]MBC3935722.1 LysR family transcriptional regulator [Undibacterium rugosum]